MKATAPVLIATLLSGLMAAPAATADNETIYKWEDDEGVVHYSTRPPDGVDFVEMGIELDGDPAPQSDPQVEETPESRPAEPPEQPQMTRTEPDPEVVRERCEQARSNLQNLTRSSNIVMRGEDGEQRRISEEERERMMEEAQAFIDEWC